MEALLGSLLALRGASLLNAIGASNGASVARLALAFGHIMPPRKAGVYGPKASLHYARGGQGLSGGSGE